MSGPGDVNNFFVGPHSPEETFLNEKGDVDVRVCQGDVAHLAELQGVKDDQSCHAKCGHHRHLVGAEPHEL